MATAADVKRIAMGLEGTIAAPHFDRIAYRVKRIYATVGGDKLNLNLLPDEQEFKVMMAPNLYAAIPGGWGRQGWTIMSLPNAPTEELEAALRMAWEHGRSSRPKGR
jgi:hypothetical protein